MPVVAAAEAPTPLWIVLIVAAIPAVAAVVAAVVAGWYARKASVSQSEIERLRLIEERVAATKLETYRPMLKLTGDMLDPTKASSLNAAETRDKMSDFSTWISMVGSDEAVKAYHNLMQASFANAPSPIVMRAYADFLMSARRDLGDPSTKITAHELLGQRISDLYADGSRIGVAMSGTFDEASDRVGWTPPWRASGRGIPPNPPSEVRNSTSTQPAG